MLELSLFLIYLSSSNALLPLETYQDDELTLQTSGNSASLSLGEAAVNASIQINVTVVPTQWNQVQFLAGYVSPAGLRPLNIDPWITDLNEVAQSGSTLLNDTGYHIQDFEDLYLNRASNEADYKNYKDTLLKYGISILFRFLVEFIRIFKRFSDISGQPHFFKMDLYSQAYDHALEQMKVTRKLSPLQMSLPVREAITVYTSIIYGSADLKSWPSLQCIISYLASVIGTVDCPDVWYHTLVQLLALEVEPSSVVHKILDLQDLELPSFEFMFNYTVGLIVATKEQSRDLLTSRAVFYSMVLHLQEDGLLDFVF